MKKFVILVLLFLAPTLSFGDTCYKSDEQPSLMVLGKVPNKPNSNTIRVQFKGMSKSVPFANETVAKYAFEIFKINNLLPINKRKKYCVIFMKGKVEGICLGSC